MKMIWHCCRKDLRHYRLLLVLWLALAVVQAAVVGVNTASANVVKTMLFTMVSFLIPLLQYVAMLIIVPLVIQAETPVGTTAFWYTRPLSRGHVLASKVLFIATVLILPPLVAELLVLGFNGAASRHLILAGVEIVIKQLRFVMVVAALAALTRRFAHFALVSACVVVGYFLLLIATWAVNVFVQALCRPISPEEMIALAPSRNLVQYVVLTVSGSGVLVHQYMTRRLRGSVVIAAAAVVLYFGCRNFWRWGFLEARDATTTAVTEFSDEPITVATTADSLSRVDLPAFTGSSMKIVGCQMDVGDVPPGAFVELKGFGNLRLEYPGKGAVKGIAPGTNMAFTTPGMQAPKTSVPPSYVRQLLGVDPMSQQSRDMTIAAQLMMVPADKFRQHQNDPGLFTATASFVANSYEIAANLPLTPGSSYEAAGDDMTILEVLREEGAISVIIRERQLNLMLDGNMRSVPFPFNMMPTAKKVDYVLVNQRTWELLLPDTDMMAGVSNMYSNMIPRRLKIFTKSLTFSRDGGAADAAAMDDNWLADTVLLRIEKKQLGVFSRPLRIENLVLAEAKSP